VSKERRQLPASAPTQSFITSSIPRQQPRQQQQQQQQQSLRSSQSTSYDPALAAARARAGLMNPAAAAGPRTGSKSRGRSNRVYSGYEPGYELEVHSSTYYRPRLNTGAAGSSSSSSSTSMAAALRSSGSREGPGGNVGGGLGAAPGGYSSASRPWLRPNASSREGLGLPGSVVRSSSGDGLRTGVSGGALNSSFAALGPVHSDFCITAGSGGGAAGLSGGGGGGGEGGFSRKSGPLPAEAPLDDLLQHVNHLIQEFDRMYDH